MNNTKEKDRIMPVRLNAAYFEQQGRDYAKAEVKTAHPVANLKSGSWQAKAFDRGYRLQMWAIHRAKCDAATLRAAETAAKTVRKVLGDNGRAGSTRNAVREHIVTLRNMAHDTADPKRRARYFAKADKLAAKWNMAA